MTATEHWFQKLKDVWLRQAVDEISELVAPEFAYYEEPFEAPITDVATLVSEWQTVREQDIEHLEIEPRVCTEREGTARYHFIATIAGERHESRGAYYVRLDE